MTTDSELLSSLVQTLTAAQGAGQEHIKRLVELVRRSPRLNELASQQADPVESTAAAVNQLLDNVLNEKGRILAPGEVLCLAVSLAGETPAGAATTIKVDSMAELAGRLPKMLEAVESDTTGVEALAVALGREPGVDRLTAMVQSSAGWFAGQLKRGLEGVSSDVVLMALMMLAAYAAHKDAADGTSNLTELPAYKAGEIGPVILAVFGADTWELYLYSAAITKRDYMAELAALRSSLNASVAAPLSDELPGADVSEEFGFEA